MLKYKYLIPSLILCLILTGCSFTRGEKTTEEITEEAPLVEASGTSAYYDINADVKDVATYTDADNDTEEDLYKVEESDTYELVTEYTSASEFYAELPEYSGEVSIVVNNDIPFFTEEDMTTECYTYYGELDELGRTQYSMCVTCSEDLPEGDREAIDKSIKPTGWVQNKYPGIVDSDPPYLYNRSHLLLNAALGTQSDVLENLITGTRYFNTQGMWPNEEEVLNFIKTGNMHVLYRVSPFYQGDNLLASGVLMEAKSVEDNGQSLSMCRWVYNVQPGIEIDYETGENHSLE